MDDSGRAPHAIAVADTGAAALAFLMQLIGLPADAAELLHQSGRATLDEAEILRAARRFPVKARAISSTPARLETTPLPALGQTRDGAWLVIGKAAEDKVLVQSPLAAQPELLAKEAFAERWNGRLILIARRASLSDPYRRFGVAWFVDAVKKYRQPMSEVLIASFFLQVFGLLTPLFFQVIIDKVFVHRGYSTLEVLALGLGVLSLFEVILGGLRTYLFAHTSNRIDVELGARLFRHLFALPMAYFQARRVGDTVARVRELDTIRQFLTSSAITLALDLFFAIIFLVVLFIYSPLLTVVVAGALPLYVHLEPRPHADLPRATERAVQARRREPGLPGRDRLGRRDGQVDGARAGDAEALGGADLRLRPLGLLGHRRRQSRHPDDHPDQQGDHRPHPLPRGRASSSTTS